MLHSGFQVSSHPSLAQPAPTRLPGPAISVRPAHPRAAIVGLADTFPKEISILSFFCHGKIDSLKLGRIIGLAVGKVSYPTQLKSEVTETTEATGAHP